MLATHVGVDDVWVDFGCGQDSLGLDFLDEHGDIISGMS